MFRPPRIPGRLVGATAAVPGPSTQPIITRSYAISLNDPVKWPRKTEPRVFTPRKTFLYSHFTSILQRAHDEGEPLLFLQHKNFRAQAMARLRWDIATAATSNTSNQPEQGASEAEKKVPRLHVVRTSIFGVALREYAPMDRATTESIKHMANGAGFAVLTFPVLDPPRLQAVLRALDRAVPKKRKDAAIDSNAKGKGKGDDDDFVPGRRIKRQRPVLDPELKLLGALIGDRLFSVDAVKEISQLPTLETLREQIVGLLSSPAIQLSMLLGEAGGGRLARTLEGLKKMKEEEADGTAS